MGADKFRLKTSKLKFCVIVVSIILFPGERKSRAKVSPSRRVDIE